MSVDTKSKKRKSGDNIVPAAKKAKTLVKKAEDAPAPLKSALKKSKGESPAPAKEKAAKTPVPKAKASTGTAKATESEKKQIVEDDDRTELSADQTAALLAGFSSDEEEDEVDEGLDIASLPKAPVVKDNSKARVTKSSANGETDPETTPGTIYIGRLPHGFFERQLSAYFSQFGTILNIRLARNKKTGKSQHHAFIEFASAAVADIVVKTMDKYLLFGHIMQVRRVPTEQVNEKMWKGSRGVRNGRVMPRNRIEGSKLRRGMEREKWETRIEREEARRKNTSEKMKELGYIFEMPQVKSVSTVAVKPKAVEASEAEPAAIEGGPVVIETTITSVQSESDAVKTTVEKTVKRKTKAKEASGVRKSSRTKAA